MQELTHDQQHTINEFRYRLHKTLIVEIHGFMQQHRDIHVEWTFTLDGKNTHVAQEMVYCVQCQYEHEVPECH